MGFLDNLSEKISAGAATAQETAKKGWDITKLTATVEKEKVVQDKLFCEIGKKLYEEAKDVVSEKCPDACAKLDESVKKVEEAKEEIRKVKGNVVCPGCGKEVSRDTKFCPACGAVIPEPVAEDACEETCEEETHTEE